MFILTQNNSIASHFISDLRDVQLQQDRMRFRRNMERIGEILAYEISKTFAYQHVEIQTPLAEIKINKMIDQPVLVSILRAGLPFYQGFLNIFDKADSGFLGAYRKPETNEEVEIDFLYQAAPGITGKNVILIDPMLATGKSILTSIENLLANGMPKMVHIASIIAAPEGIAFLEQNLKVPYCFWIGALDQKLNSQSYIIPGLGDAGDLCFGPKL
jgi:uracil phosphoribosyltransferase